MEQEGKLLTCDRCGIATLRPLAENGLYNAAHGWATFIAPGGEYLDLCPACNKELKMLYHNFLDNQHPAQCVGMIIPYDSYLIQPEDHT